MPLEKRARLAAAATALGAEMTTPPSNVTFTAGPNAAGIEQPACTLCGDCCSGCNVGAKNTVQMTYLPDAARHGASIFTEATVSHVRQDGELARFSADAQSPDKFGTPTVRCAPAVVLGRRARLDEILLRSRSWYRRSDGLRRLTGNGDGAFAYNGDKPANAVALATARGGATPPGPCIMAHRHACVRRSKKHDHEEGCCHGSRRDNARTFSVVRAGGRDKMQHRRRAGASAGLDRF